MEWVGAVSSILQEWLPAQLVRLTKDYVGVLDVDLMAILSSCKLLSAIDLEEYHWLPRYLKSDPGFTSTLGVLLVAENLVYQAFGEDGNLVPELAHADPEVIHVVRQVVSLVSQPQQTLDTLTGLLDAMAYLPLPKAAFESLLPECTDFDYKLPPDEGKVSYGLYPDTHTR